MATREAMGTSIDAALVARVAQMTGQEQAWFGPLNPLPPIAPASQQESVAGRQFDYPVGYNQRTQPRTGEGITFAEMRGLADGYDLLRLVIETRKDQMEKLRWTVRPKDKKAKVDARCDAIREFLELPDKEHTWNDWLRMLLEDLFVLDAPALYVRPTVGGQLYSLEPVDGSTIKRVLDEHGRTPVAPLPAYQQILKGVPAINYTTDELIYKPRNLRTNKVYGYGPVEQIIMTVNIALRRQVSQLQYYTEGNVPEALIGVPKEWNPDQIKQFQAHWDSLMEGNTAEKRHAKFVPDAVKYQPTREPVLKDQYDEWLARIVCFAFSISPQPFVAQVNRSTAETAKQAATEEGLAPIMNWVARLVNYILVRYFKAPDLEFAWEEEEEVDPKTRAEIAQIYINSKVLSPDEVREDLGKEPMTPEEREASFPTPSPPIAPAATDEPKLGEPKPPDKSKAPPPSKEAVAKAKKAIRPIKRDRPAVEDSITAASKPLAKFLKAQAPKIAAQIADAIGLQKSPQAGGTRQELFYQRANNIIGSLDLSEWEEYLPGEMEPYLAGVAIDGGTLAIGQVLDEFGQDVLDLMRTDAKAYAEERAAEMVGMKWVDGELVPNPNAEWVITDSTRDMLQDLTSQALEEGWSADELASAINEDYAFSDTRAEAIARTELAFADTQGQAAGWKATGMVDQKEWLAAPDCCDICQEMNGKLAPVDGTYEGGASVPLHPNCRCDELPVIKEETES